MIKLSETVILENFPEGTSVKPSENAGEFLVTYKGATVSVASIWDIDGAKKSLGAE